MEVGRGQRLKRKEGEAGFCFDRRQECREGEAGVGNGRRLERREREANHLNGRCPERRPGDAGAWREGEIARVGREGRDGFARRNGKGADVFEGDDAFGGKETM